MPCRPSSPDLWLITDVVMPVMDGYELVRRLRLDPAFIRLPVLFYSAPHTANAKRGRSLGRAACPGS